MEAGNESHAFSPCRVPLAGYRRCSVLGGSHAGRGAAPSLGTSLPAKSPACEKYCVERVAWGWQSAGRRRDPFLGEWGRAPEPVSPQGGRLLCGGLLGSPSLMASHSAQAELPKLDRWGWWDWRLKWLGCARGGLAVGCVLSSCACMARAAGVCTHTAQQLPSSWWSPASVAALLP